MSELVLSLFSGAGVLDEGFRRAGFCVVSAGDLCWGGFYDVRGQGGCGARRVTPVVVLDLGAPDWRAELAKLEPKPAPRVRAAPQAPTVPDPTPLDLDAYQRDLVRRRRAPVSWVLERVLG